MMKFNFFKKIFVAGALSVSVILGNATPSFANVTYANKVTEDMCESSYWYDKTNIDSERILMDTKQITSLNEACLRDENTHMYDLENVEEKYNAKELRDLMITEEFDLELKYVNCKEVKSEEYFAGIKQAIAEKGFEDETRNVMYALTVEIADQRACPTDDYVGYSANDPDDELQLCATRVNEPFVILQRCEYNNKLYYWGYTNNCSGWIAADSLAICKNKQEWLDAWKVDINAKDFLVVTSDKVFLDESYYEKSTSKVELGIGSILKLVPKDSMPKNISERGTWNNYVVYLPTRAADGTYERKIALVAQHNKVNIGFLPLTQKNVLDVAFSCLGNRYGWGGMLNATDCSMFSKDIYRCFGLSLPRNTTWQKAMPQKSVDLSTMSLEEKREYIKTLPAGSMLYFPGHTFMYIGHDGDELYCIGATGSLVDSDDSTEVYNINTIVINPISVKRKNLLTWLECIDKAVVLADESNMIPRAVSYSLDKTEFAFINKQIKPVVTVKDYNNNVIDSKFYNVTYGENLLPGKGSVTVTFKDENPQTKTLDFNIISNAQTAPTLANVKSGIKITWNKNDLASSYKILRSVNGGAYKTIYTTKNAKTLNYTDKKASNGRTYSYKIAAYITADNNSFWNELGADKSIVRLTRPEITVKKSNKKFTVQWKKNKKAAGYVVRFYKGKTYKDYKLNKPTRVSKTFTKLSANKKYKVCVRSYSVINKVKYYSAWSKTKTVSIK